MTSNRGFLRELRRARPQFVGLLSCTILLGLLNFLLVNQKVVLYVFYLPVIYAAWKLPKRGAVGVALLAALMVVAYAQAEPRKLGTRGHSLMLWTDLATWGGILVVTAFMVAALRARIQSAMESLQNAYQGVLAILTRFIQTVDADTEAHGVRVAAWAVRIADEMRLGKEKVEEIRIASLLHDIGKVDVGVEVLRKAAALSDEEQERIRDHTSAGAAIVKPVGGMLAHVAETIEAHHEKYDGTGYRGLQAEEIPLCARIVAVADAFDALLSDRPYRKGVGVFEAVDRILASAGSHFDPKVVGALHRIATREGEEGMMRTIAAASTRDLVSQLPAKAASAGPVN